MGGLGGGNGGMGGGMRGGGGVKGGEVSYPDSLGTEIKGSLDFVTGDLIFSYIRNWFRCEFNVSSLLF